MIGNLACIDALSIQADNHTQDIMDIFSCFSIYNVKPTTTNYARATTDAHLALPFLVYQCHVLPLYFLPLAIIHPCKPLRLPLLPFCNGDDNRTTIQRVKAGKVLSFPLEILLYPGTDLLRYS